MTDRELLEKAAIVGGVPLDLTLRPDGRPLGCNDRGLAIAVEPGWWNPLADDGDALRLAVTLRLSHLWQHDWLMVYRGDDSVRERDLSDPYAATRRAVVRAAAAIADAAGAA